MNEVPLVELGVASCRVVSRRVVSTGAASSRVGRVVSCRSRRVMYCRSCRVVFCCIMVCCVLCDVCGVACGGSCLCVRCVVCCDAM